MKLRFLSFYLSVLLIFFSVDSKATDFGTLSVIGSPSAGASVGRGSVTAIVEKAPAGSGATVLGEFQMLLKKHPYTITGGRTITAAGIIGGAVKMGKIMGPLGLAFTLGPIIWNPIKGLWEKLDGNDTYPAGRWCVGKGTSYESCAADPSSACSGYYAHVPASRVFVGVSKFNDNTYACLECPSYNPSCSPPSDYYYAYRDLTCPTDYVFNPSTNMCEQRKYVPASDNDLHNAITNKVNESPSNASNQANKNRENDEPGFVKSMGPLNSISGPSESVPETSTKETSVTETVPDLDSDGIPETQTTTTQTTTTTVYHFTYNTDNSVRITEQTTTNVQSTTTITYSATNTTTTVVNPTTTTTTTTNPGETVQNPSEPGQDLPPDNSSDSEWPAFCVWAAIVCDFINWFREEPTIPDLPILPVEDVSVGRVPWSLNLGGGSCPPDVLVNLPYGKTMNFSYAIPCSILSTYIYPIVMLISAILSVYILSGIKSD